MTALLRRGILKIFLSGNCQAPTAVHGTIVPFNGTAVSPDGIYPVGTTLGYLCDTGFEGYPHFFYSDCIEPGIWAAPLTDCIPIEEGGSNSFYLSFP